MKKKLIFVVAVLAVLSIFYYIFYCNGKKNENMIYGTSFSSAYAQYLGYDYKEVYDFALKEMGFKYVRLITQWDEIEKKKGEYDFTAMDYLMDKSAEYDVKVILESR